MKKLTGIVVFSILYCVIFYNSLESTGCIIQMDRRPISANLSMDSYGKLTCHIYRGWNHRQHHSYNVSFSVSNITFGYYSPVANNRFHGKMIWHDSKIIQEFNSEEIPEKGDDLFSVLIKPKSNFLGNYQCNVQRIETHSKNGLVTPNVIQQANSNEVAIDGSFVAIPKLETQFVINQSFYNKMFEASCNLKLISGDLDRKPFQVHFMASNKSLGFYGRDANNNNGRLTWKPNIENMRESKHLITPLFVETRENSYSILLKMDHPDMISCCARIDHPDHPHFDSNVISLGSKKLTV